MQVNQKFPISKFISFHFSYAISFDYVVPHIDTSNFQHFHPLREHLQPYSVKLIYQLIKTPGRIPPPPSTLVPSMLWR